MSTGNEKDDKKIEAFIEAEESIEGVPPFCFSLINCEIEPEGSVRNVDGRGNE